MGLFSSIKIAVAFIKVFKEQAQREKAYIKMSNAELSRLSDEELCDAGWLRADKIVSSKGDFIDGFNSLNEEQRVFYAVYYLDLEVNNGGLCQFFVNSSRMVAPIVSECMEIIGATKHKKLYDTFISKHQINTYDLSSFDCETAEARQSRHERYPFNEFDDAFYKLEPLQDYLAAYMKEHIEQF